MSSITKKLQEQLNKQIGLNMQQKNTGVTATTRR
jgi:hypothetical protein